MPGKDGNGRGEGNGAERDENGEKGGNALAEW